MTAHTLQCSSFDIVVGATNSSANGSRSLPCLDATTPPEKGLERSSSDTSLTLATEETSGCRDDVTLSTSTTTTTRQGILKAYDFDAIPRRTKRRSWKQLPKPDLETLRTSLSTPVAAAEKKRTPTVRFNEVHARAYDQTIGDNPSVSYGTPICLDWTYEDLPSVDLDLYEASIRRRTLRQMMLNYYHRRDLLIHRLGWDEQVVKEAEKAANRDKRRRAWTIYVGRRLQLLEEVVETVGKTARRKR